MFYHNRENLNRNVKIKLDVTNEYFLISMEAMKFFKNNEVVNFVMVDINGGLKVVYLILSIYVIFLIRRVLLKCQLFVFQKVLFLSFDTLHSIILLDFNILLYFSYGINKNLSIIFLFINS